MRPSTTWRIALFELGQADEALDLFREAAQGPRRRSFRAP